MFSFLKSTKESIETDLSYNFDFIPQLPDEHPVLQQITALISQIKNSRNDLFANLKILYAITDLDSQKDSILDTLIFWLWGISSNYKGEISNAKISFIEKSPYIIINTRLEECHDAFRQYVDSLQKYFKLVLEDFKDLKKNIQDFESLKTVYGTMYDAAKAKVKDGNLGYLERGGIGAKSLSNISKLKFNSEALIKLELKIVKETYMAKVIIANAGTILAYVDDIGKSMNKELGGIKAMPNNGKRFYPTCNEVLKGRLDFTSQFIGKIFKMD